jgi:hypothetical protein
MNTKELDKEIDNGNITPDYKAGYLEAQKEILEKIETKLILLEDYLDDLIKKTIYHINISEHTGDMRKLIKQIKQSIKGDKKE